MPYEIYTIEASPSDIEQLGTKEKFWFLDEETNKKWLFKYSRENTGEHWSEKVAQILCKELCIPHVQYEIAKVNGRIGIMTQNIIPETSRMVMGNEVLHNDSPSNYPEPKSNTQQQVRVKEHTISRVLGCLDLPDILPPKDWDLPSGLNAADVFCGYLMLDALISNQDRHHENWAIVIDSTTQKKHLCETYDHAASLGRELTDKNRRQRLTTNDNNQKVAAFVRKARSELFRIKKDKRPMFTTDTFIAAVEKRGNAKNHWLNKLKMLPDARIMTIFSDIPNSIISGEARSFALQMVLENKKRLLPHD